MNRMTPAILTCDLPLARSSSITDSCSRAYCIPCNPSSSLLDDVLFTSEATWPEIIYPNRFCMFPTLASLPSFAGFTYIPKPGLIHKPESPVFHAINEDEYDSISDITHEIREQNESLCTLSPYTPLHAFSLIHEQIHNQSLNVYRTPARYLSSIASSIYNLLIRDNSRSVFLPSFSTLNKRLIELVGRIRVFEETIANITTLFFMPRHIQFDIIDLIEDNISDPYLQYLFLFGARFCCADDYDGFTAFIQLLCKEELSAMSVEHNGREMFQSGDDVIFGLLNTSNMKPKQREVFMLNSGANLHFACLESPHDPDSRQRPIFRHEVPNLTTKYLFLESMRQQLAQVRGLSCPFYNKRHKCCGFGHYLSGIWSNIPDIVRRNFSTPARSCIKSP